MSYKQAWNKHTMYGNIEKILRVAPVTCYGWCRAPVVMLPIASDISPILFCRKKLCFLVRSNIQAPNTEFVHGVLIYI